jgi:electron transport protein HydN
MNRFVSAIPARCIGCRTCELACAVAHPSGAAPGPLTAGTLSPNLSTVKTKTVSAAVTCHHCEDAPCLNACPTAAISYRQGTVQIAQDRCIGCKTCMMACPFGAIRVTAGPVFRRFAGMTLALGIRARAQKCDLCIDLPGGPACVSVCPTKALRLVDSHQAEDVLHQRRRRSAQELAQQADIA